MVDEADDENAETVDKTEMEMLPNLHMRSGDSSPSPPEDKTLVTLAAIPARGQVTNKLPPLPPRPLGQQRNNDELQHPEPDGYMDFFPPALRNLGGETPANRELAIFIATRNWS
jgi:hypothetical protein